MCVPQLVVQGVYPLAGSPRCVSPGLGVPFGIEGKNTSVAFPPYDVHRRLACLKYLVLANMLMKSGINPFDSTETKAYKNNPEVLAMTNLVR